MISVNFLGEWHELDTLNGYYSLEDLKGPSPLEFVKKTGPHDPYSIQLRKRTWANQQKVYEYCAWADPEFKALMEEALDHKDPRMALAIATGVTHK